MRLEACAHLWLRAWRDGRVTRAACPYCEAMHHAPETLVAPFGAPEDGEERASVLVLGGLPSGWLARLDLDRDGDRFAAAPSTAPPARGA